MIKVKKHSLKTVFIQEARQQKNQSSTRRSKETTLRNKHKAYGNTFNGISSNFNTRSILFLNLRMWKIKYNLKIRHIYNNIYIAMQFIRSFHLIFHSNIFLNSLFNQNCNIFSKHHICYRKNGYLIPIYLCVILQIFFINFQINIQYVKASFKVSSCSIVQVLKVIKTIPFTNMITSLLFSYYTH